MIIATPKNQTLLLALIGIFSIISLLSIAAVIILPLQALAVMDRADIKFMMILLWETIVLFALTLYYYSSIRFSPLELAAFIIRWVILVGFLSAASPFGTIAIESLSVAAGDKPSFDLRLANAESRSNATVFLVALGVFFVAYTLLCSPPFRKWSDRRPK